MCHAIVCALNVYQVPACMYIEPWADVVRAETDVSNIVVVSPKKCNALYYLNCRGLSDKKNIYYIHIYRLCVVVVVCVHVCVCVCVCVSVCV